MMIIGIPNIQEVEKEALAEESSESPHQGLALFKRVLKLLPTRKVKVLVDPSNSPAPNSWALLIIQRSQRMEVDTPLKEGEE